MNKLKMYGGVALVLMLFVVSGCGSVPQSDTADAKAVQEGITKFYYDVNSASYEVKVNGDVVTDVENSDNVKFDLTANGDVDNSDPKTPQFSLILAAKGTLGEGTEQSFSGELKVDPINLYFIINNISDFDGQVPAEMVAQFLGKWWSMPIPPDTFTALDVKSDMTPEQVQIKELAMNTNFFKDVAYVGEEQIMGENTKKYSAVVNKEGIKTFTVEAAKLDPNIPDPTDSDLAEFDAFLETFDLSAELFIGVNDNMMRGINGELTMRPAEGGSALINFEFSFGKINEEVVIEAPVGAEEFDPMMLLGGGF